MLTQAKVRQLVRAPGSIEAESIEKDRETLTSLMSHLKQAQQLAGVKDVNGKESIDTELLEVWDDFIYEPVISTDQTPAPAPAPATATSSRQPPLPVGPVPIEDQLISIPSNGNIDATHRDLECSHRISLAEQHLNQIRNLIAEKSFQFSHLQRVAPRKAVATRSRSAVNKLNQQIALHSRMYSRCRSRLVSLDADSDTLSRLRNLSPSDVGASTAIINPNEPGSSSIKLSWIWQTAGGHRFGLAGNDYVGAGAGAGRSFSAGAGGDAGDDLRSRERLIECERF